jgi:Peptidase family M23
VTGGARRWPVLMMLLIVPGSCVVAAPVLVAAPSPAPVTPPLLAIGPFALDRPARQGGLAIGRVPGGTVRLVKDGAELSINPDGRFLIAFGRDHAAFALVSAIQRDGRAVTARVPVEPRRWVIENLATLPHHSQPDAEFAARRPGELAQINAARRIAVTSGGWLQSFAWPARGRISGVFGAQRIYAGEPGAPHNGVDIAGPAGATVVAPADGVVILAAATPFTLEGNLLMIDHGMGLNSAFLHLSRIDVRVGDVVHQGQSIGAIGKTGRATGPHLHWGLKWHDERLDPQALVGR